MDITHSDLIQIAAQNAEHEKNMKLSKAQEMAQRAEAVRNKTKTTYRHSLLAYINEVIEEKASKGLNDVAFYSKMMPWTLEEIEVIIPLLENQGFKAVLSLEYEKKYTGGGISASSIQSNYETVPTNNKVLKVSW